MHPKMDNDIHCYGTKILQDYDEETLSENISCFINKDDIFYVIDIKYQVATEEDGELIYSALIWYIWQDIEEIEKRKE